MSGLIVAVIAASLTAKDLVTARTAAIGCVGVVFAWGLLAQYHPIPLLMACAAGFLPVWGSFVVIRRARFMLLVPAVLLVMAAGLSIDVIHDRSADALNMHPKPIQDQIDTAQRYLREHPTQ